MTDGDVASFEPVRIAQALKLALMPVRRQRLADGNRLGGSMYRPPAFVVGCSQAPFTRPGDPMLARNHDYAARQRSEVTVMHEGIRP